MAAIGRIREKRSFVGEKFPKRARKDSHKVKIENIIKKYTFEIHEFKSTGKWDILNEMYEELCDISSWDSSFWNNSFINTDKLEYMLDEKIIKDFTYKFHTILGNIVYIKFNPKSESEIIMIERFYIE